MDHRSQDIICVVDQVQSSHADMVVCNTGTVSFRHHSSVAEDFKHRVYLLPPC